MQGRAGIKNDHAPTQSGSAMQGNRPDMPFIKMLMHLEHIGGVIETGT